MDEIFQAQQIMKTSKIVADSNAVTVGWATSENNRYSGTALDQAGMSRAHVNTRLNPKNVSIKEKSLLQVSNYNKRVI